MFSVIKPDLQEPPAFFDVRMTPKKTGETPFGLPVSKWFSELDDLNTVGVSPATHMQPNPPAESHTHNCTNTTFILKSFIILMLHSVL